MHDLTAPRRAGGAFSVLRAVLSAPPARSLLRASAGRALLSFALAGAALGQTPRLLVSTGSDVPPDPTHGLFTDGDVEAVGGAFALRAAFGESQWLATVGVVPGDVDGFAFRPGTVPGRMDSFAFSLQSDQAGFLDGDILGLAPGGGLQVLVSEQTIATALGASGVNIDVDGFDYDDAGNLLFTLQSDLATSVFGPLKDGDVLRLLPTGNAQLLLSEAGIQQYFTMATGSTSAIGDVQGIDWVGGELWVAIQSPSAYDGGVLACGATGTIVADESLLGLGGAELDALSVLPGGELPGCSVDPRTAPTGSTFQVEFHGRPNSAQLVLMSGSAGYVGFPQAPGFGAWYLDPTDPWLGMFYSAPAPPIAFLDANGDFAASYTLPVGLEGTGIGGEPGWTFQMIDLGTLELAAPVRIAMR